MGIEPTALAWEARVLPLYDARWIDACTCGAAQPVWQSFFGYSTTSLRKNSANSRYEKAGSAGFAWGFT